MRTARILVVFLIGISAQFVVSQTPTKPSEKDLAAVDALFVKGNGLLEKKEYAAALTSYEEALKILPDEPAILYNAGFTALLLGANDKAVDMLARLKKIQPDDWQARAKLVQAYQQLAKTGDRDREREELFTLRKAAKNKELNEQKEYCRDRFTAGGRSVMAFEVFEFKGPRAIRYVFRIINDAGSEDYRISLGSYDMTHNIWRATTKPTPKDGVRLFHLDGYFPNGHATYAMMVGEPTYEATKKMVVDILEKKVKPVSSTVISPQKS